MIGMALVFVCDDAPIAWILWVVATGQMYLWARVNMGVLQRECGNDNESQRDLFNKKSSNK
jgi:hypothetical protein